jgi:hypothetical protein
MLMHLGRLIKNYSETGDPRFLIAAAVFLLRKAYEAMDASEDLRDQQGPKAG